MKKNEIAYYPEITRFIESQLQSNFRAEKINDIYIFWKNGELTSGLKALILEHPIECSCLTQYSEITPPLNLDIFGVVTNVQLSYHSFFVLIFWRHPHQNLKFW